MLYRKWWLYQEIYLNKIVKPQKLRKYLTQVREGTKPLFIHINKTAGSSIANSMDITETHFTLKQYEALYKNKFGEQLPQDIEIWASIRNPFDKVASEYFYRIKTNQNKMKTHPITFDAWVKKAYLEKDPAYRDREIMFVPQSEWITGNRDYNINLIRFENLTKDHQKLIKKFNAAPLGWKKKSNNVNYSDTFSETSRAIISNIFLEDLKRFNYSY